MMNPKMPLSQTLKFSIGVEIYKLNHKIPNKGMKASWYFPMGLFENALGFGTQTKQTIPLIAQ